MRLRPMAGALAAALILAGACTTEQAYRQDDRLELVSPSPRAQVRLPVRITWRAEDFTVAQPAWKASAAEATGARAEGDGYFAVFVDRPPLPPGVELLSIAGADPQCKRDPACPDTKYLADRGIHLTTEPELELTALVDRRRSDSSKDWHEATVVLMQDDRTGIGEIGEARRLGTAGVTVRFYVERS